jgi:tRNA threonylcarbamoyladenosine biosynthesis protein TsaE
MSEALINNSCETDIDVKNDLSNISGFALATDGVDATKNAGAALAKCLLDGDFVALCGDLGAGKTQFVQGVAKALGVIDDVISPTFNILLQYQCSITAESMYKGPSEIDHFDLYRLGDAEELDDIDYFGITDEFSPGVSFVEWADKFEDALPDDYLRLCIERTGETSRRLRASFCGARSGKLLRLWAQGLCNAGADIDILNADAEGGVC